MTNKFLDLKDSNLFMADDDVFYDAVNHKSFFKVKAHYVAIVLPIIEEKTRGGLYMPEETQDYAKVGLNIGRIVGLGPNVGVGKSGALADYTTLEVGQWIHFLPHVGAPLRQYGANFRIVCDEDIMAILAHPKHNTDEIFSKYRVKGLNYEAA